MKLNMTYFFLVVFLVAAFAGWDWPNIAKIMPVYVAAIPGLMLVVLQIYRDSTAWDRRDGNASGGIDMDESGDVQLDKKTELTRTLGFFGWFVAGALGIWLLGLVIALPLLVFLYTLVEGKEKWYTALVAAALTYALVWGLFEYMLETRWPAGALFG